MKVKAESDVENDKGAFYSTNIPQIHADEEITVFDLRSDTFSTPSTEMRKVMFEAEVGDAVFNEDPTKNALEKKAAEIFGMEASVLVTSGTMANLVAILVHCNMRNSEIIVGNKSHIMLFEQVGAAQFGGANVREIKNNPDGSFDIDVLKNKIRTNDFFEPLTRLICVENTHNTLGGKVLPLEWLDQLVEFANNRKVALHMDGARIFNASVALGVPVSRIVRGFSTVSFCLSKGLGCPYGSILLGSKTAIDHARKIVKGLGGGSRQIGFMAAAGIYALDNMIERIKDDHDVVQKVANFIRDSNHPYIKVDVPEDIHSNILMIYTDKKKLTAYELLNKFLTPSKDESPKSIIKSFAMDAETIRLVVHCSFPHDKVPLLLQKIQFVLDTST